MTKAFVHGNPEIGAIWSVLVNELAERGVEDVEVLSPPGFGAPLPDGFKATREGYCKWLVTELERLGGDVDLVGHDWGAGHLYGVLAERPDLLRSWVADSAGILHPEYQWHDAAQAWQMPEVGEEAIAAMSAMPAAETAVGLVAMGIPEEVAARMAEHFDATMGSCILSLYRSAVQPALARLGAQLAEGEMPPGLVIVATEDEYTGTPAMCLEVADSLGADFIRLKGLGHWWMFDGADIVADALVEHWHSV